MGCWPVFNSRIDVIDEYVERVYHAHNTHSYIVNEVALNRLLNGGLKENMIVIDEYVSVSHSDIKHPRVDLEDIYNLEKKLVAYKTKNDVAGQDEYSENRNSKYVD